MTFGDRSRRIKKDGPALLWQQVAADLSGLIDDGTLTGRLPAETELAEVYDVARVTVRRAIGSLVDAGRLTVTHGRGTYVVD